MNFNEALRKAKFVLPTIRVVLEMRKVFESFIVNMSGTVTSHFVKN